MRVSVSLLPEPEAVSADIEVAVVIDVLRATSVMAVAIAAGARRIVTCRTVGEARQLAAFHGPDARLCGERGCRRVDGFHFGNSPREYAAELVSGRTLVLTTTNGTRAVQAARNAPSLLASSFLNLNATVSRLAGAEHVHLLCAGTDGRITAEDVLAAGALVERLTRLGPVELVDDEPRIALGVYRAALGGARAPDSSRLAERLRDTRGGRNLIREGYAADLDFCARVNSIDVVPERTTVSPATFEARSVSKPASGD
jgi:2-phosphosulfolactate phosphatase